MVYLKLRRFLLLQRCMPLLWYWILAAVTFCPTLFRILRPIYTSLIKTVTHTVMELFKNKNKSSKNFGKFSNFTQMQERNIIDNFLNNNETYSIQLIFRLAIRFSEIHKLVTFACLVYPLLAFGCLFLEINDVFQ